MAIEASMSDAEEPQSSATPNPPAALSSEVRQFANEMETFFTQRIREQTLGDFIAVLRECHRQQSQHREKIEVTLNKILESVERSNVTSAQALANQEHLARRLRNLERLFDRPSEIPSTYSSTI